MKKYELLAVGGVYVDINCTDFPFGPDGIPVEKEIVNVGSGYEMVAGGSALNFNRLCQKLGMASVIIGKVGDDRCGKLLAELVAESGVKPELIVDPKVCTNLGINFINPNGETIIASVGNANQTLTAEDVKARATDIIPEAQYLYLGSCMKLRRLLPAYAGLIKSAVDTDTKIVIDHGRITNATTEMDLEMIRQLVTGADYYFPSKDEFTQLWNVDSIEDGLKSKDWGKTQVAVKDGANGAYVLSRGKIEHIPGFDVTPVNTVGAGDAFNAGVIAATRAGETFNRAIIFGCATAALKISQAALPNWDEIQKLVG
jgi:ribokinase